MHAIWQRRYADRGAALLTGKPTALARFYQFSELPEHLENRDLLVITVAALLLSTLAAIQAPIILMSQNRAGDRDRHQAEADYETNRVAKEEIESLQKDLSRIEQDKLDRILSFLEKKG